MRLHHGTNRIEAVAAARRDGVEVESADRRPFFADPASAVRDIAVNVGGEFTYVGDGAVWEPDRAWSEERSWGFTGGRAAGTRNRMSGTAEEPLFQSTRAGVSKGTGECRERGGRRHRADATRGRDHPAALRLRRL